MSEIGSPGSLYRISKVPWVPDHSVTGPPANILIDPRLLLHEDFSREPPRRPLQPSRPSQEADLGSELDRLAAAADNGPMIVDRRRLVPVARRPITKRELAASRAEWFSPMCLHLASCPSSLAVKTGIVAQSLSCSDQRRESRGHPRRDLRKAPRRDM